ncbi:hypothetical protein EVAR_68633_1 [Eumeta japonica]|uniref:Uncharacterized protein n=1 Tax=Eumeta variegata TaxID=151549 RepID=A0A4C1ZTN6_EUMVA|nr:hypothetical protein EVAR_68633_1 [Eumeta japonica]
MWKPHKHMFSRRLLVGCKDERRQRGRARAVAAPPDNADGPLICGAATRAPHTFLTPFCATMPACAAEFGRLARSNTELVFSPRAKLCHHQPPPFTALRRSFSSTFSLIPEERAVSPERPPPLPRLLRLVLWFPRLMLRPLWAVFALLAHPAWRQILVVLPTLWIAAWLFIFWKCVEFPLGLVRLAVRVLGSDANGGRRTVLVGGGGCVQALHLARNFHSAGARVVAFEVEGQFALLKYSAAVDRFYTVPRPNPADPLAYARALREIVEREHAVFYVPVSAATPAYYDALAKPHLEVLGCQCFVPCARDVLALDDPLELMRACRAADLPTPQFWVVANEDDVRAWYESGASREARHFIASAGPRGARDRLRFALPEDREQFRFPREISAEKPWVIVRESRGERLLTCTTLKESRAVNNVTCRVDGTRKGLVPQRDEEVDTWVTRFVSLLTPARPLTGHVSFRLVREEGGRLVALGARVGVSLPYLCQSTARCGHGAAAVDKLLGSVLDTREALFAYWDPLPYCAYYQPRADARRAPPPEPCKTPPNVPL